MQKDRKDKIVAWLQGKRDFSEGAALYHQYGKNLRLKREFGFGETETLREILIESLKEIAGVDERTLSLLKHSPETLPQKSEVPVYPPSGGKEKEMIRFRDRFPFLKDPDCPDILKITVADLFSSYEQYKKSHGKLTDAAPDEVMYEECRDTVENYLKNRQGWDLLEYYKTHGTLPEEYQEKEKGDEISQLSDLDLAAKLKSAIANESKHKKNLANLQEKGESTEKAEGMVQYWTARKNRLKEEEEKRKKK